MQAVYEISVSIGGDQSISVKKEAFYSIEGQMDDKPAVKLSGLGLAYGINNLIHYVKVCNSGMSTQQ